MKNNTLKILFISLFISISTAIWASDDGRIDNKIDEKIKEEKLPDLPTIFTVTDEHNIIDNLKIIRLDPSDQTSIDSAKELIAKVFDKNAVKTFEDAVKGKPYKEEEVNKKIYKSEFMVVIDKAKNNRVAGIVGLSFLEEDYKDAVWGDWFAVDETYRGKGIGTELSLMAFLKAYKLEKKKLRLYTEDAEFEKNANKLYELVKIKVIKKEPVILEDGTKCNRLWREIDLDETRTLTNPIYQLVSLYAKTILPAFRGKKDVAKKAERLLESIYNGVQDGSKRLSIVKEFVKVENLKKVKDLVSLDNLKKVKAMVTMDNLKKLGSGIINKFKKDPPPTIPTSSTTTTTMTTL
ncbi:MAG: GNAT family N-acetyltransferase [Oligoflexia bacterium]|nr:GNAT family N-acetyltransferase [Oligoflexia bacterium]